MTKASNNKKVIAVVVTYNRKELLKESIEALLKQDYKNCDILIIDNASTDGTKEYINDLLKNKKVHYENTGANLGGAGGFNYGIKKAYEIGCDFVWIMDDDCIVHNDSLTKLLEADKKLDGNYGFLASKVLWKDGTISKMNIQKKTFSRWLKDYDKNYQKIVMSSFVSLFIKMPIIKELGLPIKDFFIWTDDWEYTRRISRKYDCYYISSSVVTHKSKQNEGASIATVDDRLERFKYLYRNDCVLYRGERLKGKILFSIRIIIHKLRILKSNKKDKKERIRIINNAIKEGKKFYPEIEYAIDELTNNIKFSIIMPAYNSEKTIDDSIRSVINQLYKNYELIIVNDGSIDNTDKIVKKYLNKKNNIKYFSKKNNGPSSARNYGILNSTGDYILFLDSDDILIENILYKLAQELNAKDYDVLMYKTIYTYNDKIIVDEDFSDLYFSKDEKQILLKSILNKFEKYNKLFCFDGVAGKAIKRKLLVENNIKFPENTMRFEDAIFCYKLYLSADDISYINVPGVEYKKHNNSICNSYNNKICEYIYTSLSIFNDISKYKQDFYIKCVTSLSECERLYFFNKKYNKNYKNLKKEYYDILNRKLYKEAIENIDISKLPISYKIELYLLKSKKFRLYISLKKLYFKLKY